MSDEGKPLGGGTWDITATIQNFRYFAGWADKISGKTIEVSNEFEHDMSVCVLMISIRSTSKSLHTLATNPLVSAYVPQYLSHQ